MREYITCWYFFNINVRFQAEVCSVFYDVIAIVSVKRSDYRIHFLYMSKDEATNLLKNDDLNGKVKYYKTKNG